MDRVVVPVKNPETEYCLLEMGAAILGESGELVVVNVVEVPPQVSLSQSIEAGSKALEMQKAVLDQAEQLSSQIEVDSGIAMRTRAVVGRDVGESVLRVLREEDADHLVVGWDGEFSRSDYVLGSKLDPLVRLSKCEVTVVRKGGSEGSSIGCLVGEGPNSPYAVQRANQIQRYLDGNLTLINYREIDGGMSSGEVTKVKNKGRRLLERMAEEAGVEEAFEILVTVGEDRSKRLLEVVEGYDYVCVGSVRPSKLSMNTVFGKLPEKIGSECPANVILVMGPEEEPETLFPGITGWLRKVFGD
ncbi:universal stress protein [Methanonatronarchaeum sp. AMET6-2]|uniref:universal stress protein n=1 Tax=Methanonatronarchaeum sp. AMET6-2 TaxID=2933293 RepID=UPI001FF6FC44|nr:universal stress protein [Methanonatronarchaeum sp. AMET6-2]UOY09651.1 universal stress protein [Methanonatronarchaeum sp. AMET6-2]